jgi:hypothetical protein
LQVRLAEAPWPFYVYLLFRPDGTPFYVGKGQGGRVFQHEREADGPGKSYKLNIIRASRRAGTPIGYGLDGFFADEADALRREVELIDRIGRHDLGRGPLANLTAGGEGTSNPSPESKERHRETLAGASAEGDRGIANRFFARLRTVGSVPLKPVGEFTPQPLKPHTSPRKPTARMAAALAAAAIASRVLLEPGCVVPRRVTVDGATLVVENGVGQDILKAGLAVLVPAADPAAEGFRLDAAAVRYVIANTDRDILLDAGVLMPDV